MDKNSIGQKIRAFRINSQLSQMDLELLINASPGSISRIENGKVNPTKETLFSISHALDLMPNQISYLFGINVICEQSSIKKITESKS
jgi:transcriptional regulator with XRE-family HTH domain